MLNLAALLRKRCLCTMGRRWGTIRCVFDSREERRKLHAPCPAGVGTVSAIGTCACSCICRGRTGASQATHTRFEAQARSGTFHAGRRAVKCIVGIKIVYDPRARCALQTLTVPGAVPGMRSRGGRACMHRLRRLNRGGRDCRGRHAPSSVVRVLDILVRIEM